MPKGLQFVTEFAGDVLKNIKWFTTDISATKTGIFIIPMSLTSKVKVEFTLDGGNIWMGMGEAQLSNIVYRGTMIVKTGDKFNLRAINATTVTYCRIFFSELNN